MTADDRPWTPERPDDEETTSMNTADAARTNDTADLTTTDATAADTAVFPDQPLHDPLPYGAGFATGQQFGYGVAPDPGPGPTVSTGSVAVAGRERSGSPVLAVAGLLSMGVAVWAILGAPVITTTVMLAAGLVVAVLVGLVMVVRR